MTNQQGAPEALRLADLLLNLQTHMGPRRPSHPDDAHCWDGYTQAAAELRRLHAENERLQQELIRESHRTAEQKLRADQMTRQHADQAAMNREARAQLAALVEAQQPSPSAAAAVGQEPPGIHALMCVISSLRDTAHFSDEEGEVTDDLRTLRDWALAQAAAPRPSPAPQADSQPAPVADWLPFSKRTQIADRHGVKVTAEFNALVRDVIQTYLETHADRAARAPADSVTAPEGPTDAQIDACARSMLYQPWGIGSRIEDARAFAKRILSKFAPPAQAADSVLEDAVRLEQIAEAIRDYHFALDTRKHGGDAARRAVSDIERIIGARWEQGKEAARRAARKQGGA